MICTVCYKVDMINCGVFFSGLTDCKVIVLGLVVIVLRTPACLSDGSENVAKNCAMRTIVAAQQKMD